MEEQLFKLFSKDLVDDNDDSKKLQLLKSIVKNQKKLEDGEVIYVRTYHQIEGSLEKIEIEKNVLKIIILMTIMGRKSKKREEFVFNIDDDSLNIVVDSDGINFFQSAERLTIFF